MGEGGGKAKEARRRLKREKLGRKKGGGKKK
jgi:hypothetical protein